MARSALLLAAVAIAIPVDAVAAEPSHVAARKPKNKKSTKKPAKKPDKKKHHHHHRSHHKQTTPEPDDAEVTVTGTDPAEVDAPADGLVPGTHAGMPDVPAPPPAPVGGSIESLPLRRERPKRGPTWFLGVRGGASVIDREGYYDFRSNRQTYHDERNARVELTLGRYFGRHVSLGLAGGTGPYPKFDAPDPLFSENTRFSVFLYHARLDLDFHAGAFVFGLGGGAAYEYTTGSFTTQDPTTFQTEMHTATFKRPGVIGAARTGFQVSAGPFAFELLAEATLLKLFRGIYVYTVSTDGPSDDEMGYAASLLLGVRLQ
ncbi:MAG TPA: hypothetical protein VIV40_37505 [Kofleriaceae bacterium]